MNTAEVTLLLKASVEVYRKEIYHNRLEINSYCKENNHLSVIWLRFQMSLIFDNFFQNLQQKIDGKLLKSSFFWSRSWTDLNYAEFKSTQARKRANIWTHGVFCCGKTIICNKYRALKTQKFQKPNSSDNQVQKMWEKLQTWEKATITSQMITKHKTQL